MPHCNGRSEEEERKVLGINIFEQKRKNNINNNLIIDSHVTVGTATHTLLNFRLKM